MASLFGIRKPMRAMRGMSAALSLLHLISAGTAAADEEVPPLAAEEPAPPPTAASTGLLPIPDYTGGWKTRGYLLGDLGGWRTRFANKGVQMVIDWTQYFQGIATGGLERDTAYGAHADYLLHLDLMRMGLVPGALITVRGESRYGQSVNGNAGVFLPVNTLALFPLTDQLDDDVPINITDLNWTQFLGEHLAVVVGKLNTLDADLNEFASGRGKSQFMDANFLFNPVAALRLPYSTLGVALLVLPTSWLTINASVINTTDASSTTGFDDFDDGQSLSVEGDAHYRLGTLPGGMNLGGLYSFDQDFAEIGGITLLQP